MKLANPRNIQSDIAEQRRVDIDNGVQLARKVDTLRATLQELERRHALYVEGTTTELRRKTEELSEEIFLKERVVSELEEQRKVLLEPLTIKWEEVNQKETELEAEKEKISELRNNLTLTKQELDTREKVISQEEDKLEELRLQINVQVEKISNASLQAQNTLLAARSEEERVTAYVEQKTLAISKKQAELSLRESNVTLKEKQLEGELNNIINEKIRLADQRATLQRAMSRIKKNV